MQKQQMEEKLYQFVNTVKGFLSEPNQHQNKETQIAFNDIISERNSIQSLNNPTNINEKVKIAIKNSSLPYYILHSKHPEQTAQKVMNQDSQIMKQIENDCQSVDCGSQVFKFSIQSLQNKQPTKYSQKIQGILYKISPSFFGGDSYRYCTLQSNKFTYRQDKRKDSPIAGILNFNIISFSVFLIQKDKQKYFSINVNDAQKSFCFKAQSVKRTQEWFQKILNSINDSQGIINGYNQLITYPRFWRKDYISATEFQKNVKTGDILLFRGMKSSAVLQRKITGQQYDHIGIILHNSFGQILIFEANGGFGVGICPWKKFIKNKWYEDQEILAYRQLKINRTQQFLDEISKFVQQNIGKKYKFSLKNYLISRNSTIDEEKKSFFCSSLVAKLYKKLGLLNSHVSSDRYMPYHFADKQNLKLEKGKFGQAYLGNQKIIVFNQKMKF